MDSNFFTPKIIVPKLYLKLEFDTEDQVLFYKEVKLILVGTGAHNLSGRVGGSGGWVGWWVALEEWKLRLTSAKVEVEVEAELCNI